MYDVVIIGGALVGCSTAYHLLERDPTVRVCIIEKDATYQWSASERSNAGVRILFSQEENLRMSQYGHEFYGDFTTRTAINGEPGQLDFYRHGYLFISNTDEQARDMELNHAFQSKFGCDVALLDADGVKDRFPSLETSDITCAAYSPNDGWMDSHGALMGFRKKVKNMGAVFVEATVVAIETNGKTAKSVTTEDNQRIAGDYIVNATGAWAAGICDLVGMKIPVIPLPRMVYYFETREELEQLAFTRDGLGVGFRPEGKGYICGITNYELGGEFCFDVDHGRFDNEIWPGLANRVPKFEAIKMVNAWVGHYAQNTFDGNMIIGPYIGELDNFLIATGFSGHGLQHAPAVGRGLSELILDGSFTSINLSRLTYQRVLDGDPYPERGVKA
jgi:FAD-dependent oxidoreductase domain-containing protein 1